MDKEISASKAALIEEREDDQVVWGAIWEEPGVLMLDGMDLVDIGRRQLKRNLVAWATRVAEEFWETHQKHRAGDGVEKEYGEYGVRIIERAWTVTVQWYKARGVNKGKSMIYETMANPKGDSYRAQAGA